MLCCGKRANGSGGMARQGWFTNRRLITWGLNGTIELPPREHVVASGLGHIFYVNICGYVAKSEWNMIFFKKFIYYYDHVWGYIHIFKLEWISRVKHRYRIISGYQCLIEEDIHIFFGNKGVCSWTKSGSWNWRRLKLIMERWWDERAVEQTLSVLRLRHVERTESGFGFLSFAMLEEIEKKTRNNNKRR